MSIVVETAASMVDELAIKNKSIVVNKNSPLSPVISAITMSMVVDNEVRLNRDTSPTGDISGRVDPYFEIGNDSMDVINSMGETISKVLTLRKSVISNTILPVVKDFTKDVVDGVNEIKERKLHEISDVNVKIVELPEVIKTLSSNGYFDNYTGNPATKANINHRISFGPSNAEEVLLKLRNRPEFGYDRKEWTELVTDNIDKDKLSDILKTYFTVTAPKAAAWERLKEGAGIVNLESLERNTLILLVARLLKDQPLEETTTPYNSYAIAMNELINFISEVIKLQIGVFSRFVKTDTLILKKDTKTKTVSVVGPTFNKYLDLGYKIEAIYGALVEQNSASTLLKAYEDKSFYDGLIKSWMQYVNIRQVGINHPKQDEVKTVVHAAFMDSLKDMSDAEKALIDSINGSNSIIIKTMQESLESDYVETENDNLEEYCMELLAKARWPGLNVQQTLHNIHEVKEDIPDISNGDALNISILMDAVLYIKAGHVSCE